MHNIHELDCSGEFIVDLNRLCSVGKVGFEPVERCTGNSVEIIKSVEEDAMIDGIAADKSRRATRATSPSSKAHRMSFITLSRAVSVLCPGR